MKKLIASLLLVFIVVAGGWLGYKNLRVSSDDPPNFADINTTLAPLPCDLNLGACEVEFSGKKLKFELTPRPIYAMRPVTMQISGLSAFDIKQPSLKIYGLNMNMGVISAQGRLKDGVFSSKIVLSACVIDVMRYRFELVEDGKKTGIFIDFDLKI